MPLRQRMAEPVLAFCSQRLVEGLGSPQQEGRALRGRQYRSHSIGQLEFLPVPSASLFSSLSHPSFSSTLSSSPHHSSSHAEGVAHFSALLFRSSHFHSLDASSSLPPEGGAVTRRKQRYRSSSFGYLPLHASVFLNALTTRWGGGCKTVSDESYCIFNTVVSLDHSSIILPV